MSLVSIIVPCYNAEPFLVGCVNSIIQQSFSDWELILVNDGSKDNTPSICDDLAARDSRIKVIHQPNGGVSAARHRGVEVSTGQYIFFVDADDTIPSDTLSIYSEYMRQGYDLIASCCSFSSEMTGEEYVSNVLSFKIGSEQWTKVFKSSTYKKYELVPSRDVVMGEDLLVSLSVGGNAKRIISIKDSLYNYNKENASSVSNTFKRTYQYEKMFYLKMRDVLAPYINRTVGSTGDADLLSRKRFINGLKGILNSGNPIDYKDSLFAEMKSFFSTHPGSLSLSEKVVLNVHSGTVARMILRLFDFVFSLRH